MNKFQFSLKECFTFQNSVYFISIIIYAITAYISHGYFHADEQHQIIEFAGIKLGYNSPSDLAWEFREQIRPTFQIAFFYVIVLILKFVSITNPYFQIFIIRLITAGLAISGLIYFTNSIKSQIAPNLQKVFTILSFLLFFQPYLNVRYSSETWSGILLLFAVGVVLRRNNFKNWFYWLGALLGISFLCRFQSAFFLVGIFLWLLIVAKEKFWTVFKAGIAFLLIFLLGVAIDSWFYQKFVITAYNYFQVNIIDGIASKWFGSMPWDFYFEYLNGFPVFGKLIMFSVICLLVKNPRNILVWIILPFGLAHILTAHKEDRFLFPLANLAGTVLVLGFQEPAVLLNSLKKIWLELKNFISGKLIIIRNILSKSFLLKPIIIAVCILFILSNAIALFYISSFRNINGNVSTLKFIHDFKSPHKTIITLTGKPFFDWLNLNFYKDSVDVIQTNACKIPTIIKDNSRHNFSFRD